MPVWTKVSGVWRQVTAPSINVSGTWRTVTGIWANDAGTWRQVFVLSSMPTEDWEEGATAFDDWDVYDPDNFASVTTAQAHSGSYSLFLQLSIFDASTDASPWIRSRRNKHLVGQGAKFTNHMRWTGGASANSHMKVFYFALSSIDTASSAFYMVRMNQNEMLLNYQSGGAYTSPGTQLASDGYSSGSGNLSDDTWYRMETTWTTAGDITVDVYNDSTNALEGSMTANHTTLTTGGVGFSGLSSKGEDGYLDNFFATEL